jgi:hypothetical protein
MSKIRWVGRFAGMPAFLVFWILGFSGCHSGTAVGTANYPTPTSVTLSPAPALSLEVGTIQAMTASVVTANHTGSAQPIDYQSSNTAVATVAANGLVCGGTWNSLTSPQVCTPGPVGTAQVIATAQGVSSPPTTVYVHQHIDQVTITDLCAGASPPALCTVPRNPCQSLNVNSLPQNTIFAARAYSQGTDITSTVGEFSWQQTNTGVATFNNTIYGLANMVGGVSLNQVVATAKAPGITPVYAAIGTANSLPLNFTTCPVESISMQVTEATSNTKTFAATVTDTLGNIVMAPASQVTVPLTWSSSAPSSVSVSTSGVATGTVVGGSAAIIASCTPPTCNIGLLPTQPIYPEQSEQVTDQGTQGNQPAPATVWASSTACGTTDNCVSILTAATVPTNALSTPIALPSTPNSIVPNLQGTKVYIGTNSGFLGSKGLMVLDTTSSTVSQFTSTPGKVLAVSPDGNLVIVSDTVDTPNQVYVFNTTSTTSAPFYITGATAAAFSPDSLKAYIIAGSTLYVYSKLDSLQTISLPAPANDVAFFSEGAFAYLAGGDPAGVAVYRTCDNGVADRVTTATPAFILPVPDGVHMLAVSPPTVSVITVSATPTGCAPTVSDAPASFDLGRGNFTATQTVLTPTGSTAYIISPSFSSVLLFNVYGETSSAVTMAGSATPLQEAMSPDGTQLAVGGSDGNLHVVQTSTNVDAQQVVYTQSFCQTPGGQNFGITCNPDLIAIKP